MTIKKSLIISMLSVLTALLLSSHAGAVLLVANNETDKTIYISISSNKITGLFQFELFQAYEVTLAPGEKRRVNPPAYWGYAVKQVRVYTDYDEEYETLGSMLDYNGSFDRREVGFKNWNPLPLFEAYGVSVTCRNDEGSLYNIKCYIYGL